MIDKKRGKIVIYKGRKGESQLRVKLEEETVWLSLNQVASLFDIDKSGISRHIKNIFESKELDKKSTVAKIAMVQKEGARKVKRTIDYFNLDMVLSVGYRVNSKEATKFRVWATKTLRDYLIKGFVLNQKRLKEQENLRLSDLKRTARFFRDLIENKQLSNDESEGLLKVITDYANTWAILEQYDKRGIKVAGKKTKKAVLFDEKEAKYLIGELKDNLQRKKEASRFFGIEREGGLGGILGNINQEIASKFVYPTLEEKAANLLYFLIKDRVFIDGNKRIAAFLFLLFLSRNHYLLNKKGEVRINDSALVALTLLIAESKTRDKDIMVNLVVKLLVESV